MNIPLGYEIETGKRVTIPVNHTVVLGQTQLSGKTTTLEAMVERSGLRAVGFITKPGEKSFRLQTQIPAFFSEATIDEYWRYVIAILEYRGGTKLGWRERGVVMKLCQEYEKESSRLGVSDKSGKTKRERITLKWRAPKSLRDLLGNIEKWLPLTRGAEEMICIQLREYLRPAIKEIEAAEFSEKLKLAPGINVMDITGLSDGLKSLVIRSVIEWVHQHGRKIVVIIPEAWKFIPEGRSTPVKLALESLIREGAAVENFVWMDSQDLRGVDKMLLRSVIVWLFGVQRQKNEVASTLASIPDHPKPSATEIMQLGKGQFYVCYGTTLKHTYVQPAGMEDAHAQSIARGEESPDSWRQIVRALDSEAGGTQQEAANDESENGDVSEAGPRRTETEMRVSAALPVAHSDGGSGSTDDYGTSRIAYQSSGAHQAEAAGEGSSRVTNHESRITGDDETMWKEKYEALQAEHQTLIEAHDAIALKQTHLESENKTLEVALRESVYAQDSLADRVYTLNNRVLELEKLLHDRGFGQSSAGENESGLSANSANQGPAALADAGKPGSTPGAGRPSSPAPGQNGGHPLQFDAWTIRKTSDGHAEAPNEVMEFIWSYVRQRAEHDPGILELLTRRPELRVRVERQIIELDGGTLRGKLALLISKGFFAEPKNGNTAYNELKRLGIRTAKPNVYRELDKLCELGFVTAEDAGYQAVPGMKVSESEGAKKLEARA